MENELEIPEDFPHVGAASGVAGFQPKFSAVKYGEKYYLPGDTPPEREQQWLVCNELVNGYALKCQQSKKGKRPHMSTDELLVGYYKAALKANNYIDVAQLKW